jgi:hypothetical protein
MMTISGLIGLAIGKSRNYRRPFSAFLDGALMGPLGWVFLMCVDENGKLPRRAR